jgi:hypothetical protein
MNDSRSRHDLVLLKSAREHLMVAAALLASVERPEDHAGFADYQHSAQAHAEQAIEDVLCLEYILTILYP